MTVKDFLSRTLDYESFQLTILSFGCNDVLFNEYVNDSNLEKGNPFDDKLVSAIKFGSDWVKLILEP